ncbi:MAG TPA: cyclodeaminase/cyclohydrolase family protein [Lichenihabitans sp.]|nr:cyclodeaminase/cyclohydrolase family protein [Lichenihabitans sp.]
MVERLIASTLSRFLDDIASTEPSPGSGAAGAMTLAMGIACARKAVRITAAHHPGDDLLARADERLGAMGRAACEGAERDARHFARMIAAMQRAHDDEADRIARASLIQASAVQLIKVGRDLIVLGDEARQILVEIRDRLDPIMSNDVNAAMSLIEANRRIQSDNVAENRRHVDDGQP